MGFMKNLEQSMLEPEYNRSVTENGAIGYRTTGDILLDMNFKISTYRSFSDSSSLQYMIDQDLSALINSVPFTEDNLKLILRWIFYVRDVRGGLGERKVFRVLLDRLLNGIELSGINLYQLFKLVAEYGRWDDLIDWIYRQVENNPEYAECYIDEALQVIKDQIHSDIADSHPSLLAKWLPSENASSKLTRKKAKMMRSLLNMSPKSYRTTLSTLRKRIKVVESQMSQNEWSSIDYNAVPSKANLIYKKAFMTHDTERRQKYLDDLKANKDNVKVNAGVLAPYEISCKYRGAQSDAILYEAMWKELLNKHEDTDQSTIVVADQSGSMYWSTIDPKSSATPADVARSLAVYFAQKLQGEFHNSIITFGTNPQLVKLDDSSSLRAKLNTIEYYSDCGSTDLEKVFEVILQTAVSNHLTQDELPNNILILSDMEFNRATRDDSSTLMSAIESKYKREGYELPNLIFWNLGSRTMTIPEIKNGVKLISGFSDNLYDMVCNQDIDMKSALLRVLNSERYSLVDRIFDQE